jgi:hypothetical protein
MIKWIRRRCHLDPALDGEGPELDVYSRVMKYIEFNRLQGDYLEFGVYKGASFIAAHRTAGKLRLNQMRFFAFDSFQGLPSARYDGPTTPFREGDFCASLSVFEKALRRAGVDRGRVVIIPGWFGETLTAEIKRQYNITAVAVAWIDCDLYESTVPVLEFLVDILEQGSVLIFRDWYCYRSNRNRGELRAVGEWLGRYPDVALIPYRPVGWNGEAFLFLRGPQAASDPRRLLL